MAALSSAVGVVMVASLDAAMVAPPNAATTGSLLSSGLGEAVTFDPEPAHVVGTGWAIGAILRHWVYDRLVSERFPRSTLAVNVVGSFVLGLLVFAGAAETTVDGPGAGRRGERGTGTHPSDGR